VVTEGTGKHSIDFQSYGCTKGTILFIGNGQIHKFMQDSGLKGYLIPFHDDFLSFLNIIETTKILQLFNSSLFEPKVQLDKQTFSEISNHILIINIEYFKVNDSYSSNIIGGELFTIFSKLYRIKSIANKVTLNTKYLEKFICFQNLLKDKIFETSKVEDYAKDLGMSSKTLNTITRSIIGKQAKIFINEFYLLAIKRILTDQKLSIKECAFQSGFDDIPNFYKFFKHHLNLTPEQFRQKFC
jgi:AraC-like DNA-binding protein